MYVKKCYNLAKLMRINQPIGFFLLLWPTLWGLWISNKGAPDFFIVISFIVGVICMRSAGCVINDYIDSNIDSYVQRTKQRPIPNGTVTKKSALIIFLILIIISAKVVFTFNKTTIFLSLIALVLAVLYPYLKRYIYFPQLILGILFSWPILMTYTATSCSINGTTWLLFTANTIWTVSYDTQYAMIDREDDRRIKIKSSALLFGKMDKLIIGVLQSITVFILSIIGWIENLSVLFYCFSVLGIIILFIWQQILIYDRSQTGCFQAFLSNNYIGMLVFIGIMFNFY